MNLQWTMLFASIIKMVHAIPCSELGWSTMELLHTGEYEMIHAVQYPDPLENNPQWDIVKAKDCFVRFQVPLKLYDYTRKGARVTKTVFTATPNQVFSTMNHYWNDEGTNIMLWLPLSSRAFAYAKIIQISGSGSDEEIWPQRGLDVDYSVMSIILPSGTAKLTRVEPNVEDCTFKQRRNVFQAQSAGIVGLEGTIDSSDWAYSSGAEAKISMDSLKREQLRDRKNKETIPAWMLAEKADGNCVVIDLTNLYDFTP